MYDLPKSPRARRLTESEKTQYEKWGYVKNLPVFDQDTIPVLQEYFNEMVALMPPDKHITRVTHWHKANRKIYDLCHTSAILDYIEDILGPNIFLWGSHCFAKFPQDGTEVPWHQDAQYWPLQPMKTVSAWLALFDTDEENAAMRIVRGSHHGGIQEHHGIEKEHYMLNQEIDLDVIKPEDVVTLDLKAGEISLHDNRMIHGSGPNNSDRIRAGLVMRFGPTEVKGDVNVWPTFEINLVRGVDDYQHNPVAKVPSGNGCPMRMQPGSWEFP
jgi:non-heme Fe2+,alpha-ketoglutarate-dependent halogenase